MPVAEREIEKLLPFYVNDTLTQEERSRVHTAIEADSALRDEVAALKQLRETMRESETEATPGQFGLARLMREIEREPARKSTSAILPWGVAIAALLGLLAVGLVWITQPADAPFVQASGEAETAGLTVAFQPDAPQAAINALLVELNARIIDGPSAIGLYRLTPAFDDDADALATALRAREDLVESVDLR